MMIAMRIPIMIGTGSLSLPSSSFAPASGITVSLRGGVPSFDVVFFSGIVTTIKGFVVSGVVVGAGVVVFIFGPCHM